MRGTENEGRKEGRRVGRGERENSTEWRGKEKRSKK